MRFINKITVLVMPGDHELLLSSIPVSTDVKPGQEKPGPLIT